MKRPHVPLRRLIPLAFLVLPPLSWGFILTIAPTDWARTRIVSRLGEATGRPIQLDSLKIGMCGGVYLGNLEIGSPRSGETPWLKVASARINVSALQLLAGQIDPTELVVSDVSLRILRRADGSLELADLIRSPEVTPRNSTKVADEDQGPSAMEVRVRGGRVTVIDEPTDTTLQFAELEGQASCQHRQVTIHELRGRLNGGPFELTASLDRGGSVPTFESRLKAHGVALSQGTSILAFLAPFLSGSKEDGAVSGRLDADLYLRGEGTTRDELRRTLIGRGTAQLDPVSLEGTHFLAELSNLVHLPEEIRAGSLKTDFLIKNGRVGSDKLTMNLGPIPIVLAGWTDFDGNVDYRVRSERLSSRLPGKARALLSEIGADVRNLPKLRLHGTLDAMKVSMDHGLVSDPGRQDDASVRTLGRRIRERLLR